MFDWLKGILPENITLKLNALNFSNNNLVIQINPPNKPSSNEIAEVKDDHLIINTHTAQGVAIADRLIKESPDHLTHNDVLLEQPADDELEIIDHDMSDAAFKQQYMMFSPMVKATDLPILEVAILIKILHGRGDPISEMKTQAIQRYGKRANMICNLFTSGYFESSIKPLFESVLAGTLSIDEYLDTYEMFVTESPLAMFIGVTSNFQKAKTELLRKIELNKASDVGFINIHAIGDGNFRLTKRLLSDDEIKSHFSADPYTHNSGSSHKVIIYI